MKSMLAKVPPKEQLFFLGTVLFAAYIAAITPWSARSYEKVKNQVLTDPAVHAGLGEDRAAKVYEDTQRGIAQGTLTGGDALNIGLQKRFAVPDPKPAVARETPFRPSSQKYLPLPPASLPDVALARIPGFDAPVGMAPGVQFQIRPREIPAGRVRLTKQDDEVRLDE